jgi:hypothetical protein
VISIRAALVTSALLLSPIAWLYARALRRDTMEGGVAAVGAQG